jgi:hypothetical protein
VPVKLNDFGSDALLQMEKGRYRRRISSISNNELLSPLQNGAVFDFFDAHWSP